MTKILLIIPAFNEGESILSLIKNIKKYDAELDYIIINDGSTDNTQEICNENNLNHINLVHNLGIGGAVQTGYKYAFENGYDYAVQFDGDGQHDVRYVREVVQPLIEGKCDMVIGSRFIEEKSEFKSTFARQIGINIISLCIRLFAGMKVYDTTSGFRASNRKVIKLFSESYPTEYPEPVSTVTLLNQGFKIHEVAVEMNERENGVSSIRSWKSVYYMIIVMLSIFIISLRRKKNAT